MNCLKCRKPIKQQNIYGLHRVCYKNWFCLSDISSFSHWDPKKNDSMSHLPYIKKTIDTFYHGQYLKYSAQLNETKYIIKVQQKEYPDMPGMEYTCNQIASILGLSIPEYYLIQFQKTSNNNPIKNIKKSLMVFVTKNFMQNCTGTLNHIYQYLPKGSGYYNCKRLIAVIKTQTKKLSEVKKFIEICLFDSFIGNNDRHGRNLAIIDTGKMKKLAPMYDNPSYIGIVANELLDMKFSISGCIQTHHSKNPKIKDYLTEFNKLGFETTCKYFIKKLIKQFPKIIKEVSYSVISKKRKNTFIQFLNNQMEDLNG